MVDKLLVHDDVAANADIAIAVDAVEAFGLDQRGVIDDFVAQIERKNAVPFFVISSVTLSMFITSAIERSGKNSKAILQSAIGRIRHEGAAVAKRYDVNPVALNSEVSQYVHETLLPMLNGMKEIQLNMPNLDSEGAQRCYLISILFVTHALFDASVRDSGMEFSDAVNDIRSEIDNGVIGASDAHDAAARLVNSASHFGNMQRSEYTSPIDESLANVDIDIAIRLADEYEARNASFFREFSKDPSSVSRSIVSTLHFSRATILIISSFVEMHERDSYILAARANISQARSEHALANEFGIDYELEDATSNGLLASLSSLLDNLGVMYQNAIPAFDESNFEEAAYAVTVSLGMVASAYRTVALGKLGLEESQLRLELDTVLNKLKKK